MPAGVCDTANAGVLVASDRARMLTGTVVNATAGAAAHQRCSNRASYGGGYALDDEGGCVLNRFENDG
jgi:hypothetical protein